MRTDFLVLRQMLQYELYAAERYRRFVSLVIVASDDGLKGLRDFLGTHGRSSDVLAEFENSVAVLMGETDRSGALTAVDRYKDLFDTHVDLRFALVTFPADGGKADGLIQGARRRLKKAKGAAPGSVVYNG